MPLFQHPLPAGPRTLPESSLFCRLPPPLCCCLVAKSSLILCDPMDCSAPGSSIHGISQARILKWVAISFSRGIFPTQRWNPHLLLSRRIFTTEPPGKSSPAHPYMLEGSTFCFLPWFLLTPRALGGTLIHSPDVLLITAVDWLMNSKPIISSPRPVSQKADLNRVA